MLSAEIVTSNAPNEGPSKTDDLVEICRAQVERHRQEDQEQKDKTHGKKWQESILQFERKGFDAAPSKNRYDCPPNHCSCQLVDPPTTAKSQVYAPEPLDHLNFLVREAAASTTTE